MSTTDPEPTTISGNGNTNMTDEHDTTTDRPQPKTLREIMSDRNDPDPEPEQTDDHDDQAISDQVSLAPRHTPDEPPREVTLGDVGGGRTYSSSPTIQTARVPFVQEPDAKDAPEPGHIQRAFYDENASGQDVVDALNRVIGPHWIARLTGGRRRRHGERTLIIELGQPDESDDAAPSHGLGRNPGDPDPEDEPPKRKSGFGTGVSE